MEDDDNYECWGTTLDGTRLYASSPEELTKMIDGYNQIFKVPRDQKDDDVEKGSGSP